MAPAALSKADLFARLAAGHAAGVTVVTPNRRLAQVLKAEFDAFQQARPLSSWEDADILPLDAFVLRRYEDALYAGGGGELPLLLSDAQSRELWEAAIGESEWGEALLDVPRTAARAAQAWQLAHRWGIAGALEKFPGNEDTRAFADWAKRYARRLKKDGLVDAALLFDLGLEEKKPALVVAYAFDIVAPQAEKLLQGFELAFCRPESRESATKKTSYPSPKEELDAAARWARSRLESGAQRIGVVVPGLELRRREVRRVFARVMGSPLPFNLSLGEPLAQYPVVAFALALIELSLREIPFEAASRLIRSPFFGGAEEEAGARALLDARLRRKAEGTISLPRLLALFDEELGLWEILKTIYALAEQRKAQSPHDWALHFTAILQAAGQGRELDSAEYQARAKLNELLGEFSRLGIVSSSFSSHKALKQLQQLCSETLFQPESPSAPVQVLGLLESAGLGFDALWVSGLTDDAWPMRARPDPFLPVALQKKAGIPEAAADTSLALDQRLTAGWAGAAAEVVFSWPRREDDRDLAPSPLIAEVAEQDIGIEEFPSYRDLIFKARKTETVQDAKAPALAQSTVPGGTRVLADQAACPFRAFARHRLRAEKLEDPKQGLDERDRGTLLHRLMAGIWAELKDQGALAGDLSAVIARSALKAAHEMSLEGNFAALEIERMKRLAAEWLEVEKGRKFFEVTGIEEKRPLSLGALTFAGRIDRLDRLADGTHALIDYKTGSKVNPKEWSGDRPDDPQLPLYAVTSPEPVSAVAFAKLRAGDMKFHGYSAAKEEIPNVKQWEDWAALLDGWRKTLGSLASGFAAGEAEVDPKNGLKTCERCDLHTLCRVHEKLRAAEDEEEGE